MLALGTLAARTHEQQMRCALHETGVPRVGLLQLPEVTRDLLIHLKRWWIPPAVGYEPIVEYVQTTQILDVEIPTEAIAQLVCGKQVKGHRNTLPAAELDLASIRTVIETEVTRPVDRTDENRRSAADCTYRGDEVLSGYPRNLPGDLR